MAKTTTKTVTMTATGIGGPSSAQRQKLTGAKLKVHQKRYATSPKNMALKRNSLSSIAAALEATSKKKPIELSALVVKSLKINPPKGFKVPAGIEKMTLGQMQQHENDIVRGRAKSAYYQCVYAFGESKSSLNADGSYKYGLASQGYVIAQLDDGRVYLAQKPKAD